MALPQQPLLPTTVPTHLTFQLLIPLHLKTQGSFTHHLSFQLLFQAILRRLKDLITLYGASEDSEDNADDATNLLILTSVAHINCQHSDLYWFDVKRFSSRQHCQLAFGGLEGTVTYPGVLEPFLHVAKNGRSVAYWWLDQF